MAQLGYKFNDGGRSKYYTCPQVGDCGVRAAAIAARRDYKEIYKLCRKVSGESPRNGISTKAYHKIMAQLGAVWHPTMAIGSGCTTHLKAGEIPMNKRIICYVSRHFVAVINGVVNDTYDCTRDGTRCVYGYWQFD